MFREPTSPHLNTPVTSLRSQCRRRKLRNQFSAAFAQKLVRRHELCSTLSGGHEHCSVDSKLVTTSRISSNLDFGHEVDGFRLLSLQQCRRKEVFPLTIQLSPSRPNISSLARSRIVAQPSSEYSRPANRQQSYKSFPNSGQPHTVWRVGENHLLNVLWMLDPGRHQSRFTWLVRMTMARSTAGSV